MNRVLEQAGVVAHRQEMTDLHFRWRTAVAQQRTGIQPRHHFETVPSLGAFKRGHVTLGCLLPGHGAAARIGPFTHGLSKRVVDQ